MLLSYIGITPAIIYVTTRTTFVMKTNDFRFRIIYNSSRSLINIRSNISKRTENVLQPVPDLTTVPLEAQKKLPPFHINN